MSKKNEFLQTNSLSPFFNVVDKLLFTFFSIWGEVDPSASGKSWEINGIEFSVGVEVVKVLVELWNATAKAVNHDKGKTVSSLLLLRLKQNCVDVCIWANWYM